MDVAAEVSAAPVPSSLGRPWRFTGTAMRPNALLLCKLLLLLVLAHAIHDKFRDPYLPFLSFLDGFRGVPGLLPALLNTAFWAASVALLANLHVRTAAVTLGATVVIAILASKPLFQNHVFIVGCLFLLCGLHRRDEAPWLLRWQFVVIYFGAFLSKVLRPDWWSGAFMHTWLHDHLANPIYAFGSALLPERAFAAGVSWAVMASELLLLVLFLVRRWNRWAVAGALGMHIGFVVLVGPGPFGYFTEDLLIALLGFLAWPREPRALRLAEPVSTGAERLWPLVDWDRQCALGAPLERGPVWLELRDEQGRHENLAGLRRFLVYTPAFYFAWFGAYWIARAVV